VAAPLDSDFLCGGWVWDPAIRELRHYRRRRKGWEEEPDAAERLQPVRSVTWHRWSQAPMQSATGEAASSRLSRVVIAYERGGDLTINENERQCAEDLARTVAESYGLPVVEEGAPGGRRRGNLPKRDEMGRLVYRSGRAEVTLDQATGELVETKSKRLFGKSSRRIPLSELRRLEPTFEVQGPLERFTVWAIVGPEEERLALAGYEGFEGWADPLEWLEFAEDLGQTLGLEVRRAEG
jgi:hypothetical protein